MATLNALSILQVLLTNGVTIDASAVVSASVSVDGAFFNGNDNYRCVLWKKRESRRAPGLGGLQDRGFAGDDTIDSGPGADFLNGDAGSDLV